MANQSVITLDRILAARRRKLEAQRGQAPLDAILRSLDQRVEARDFVAALSGPPLRIIAELKRSSPTRGTLRRDFRPEMIARSYEAAGAAALSVLTEEEFFGGSLDDLKVVRRAERLPVLRKDLILDAYQVYESAAAGADAVLLIVAALNDRELRELLALSAQLRMAALVEVHTGEELERALDAGARIIGVNNRNLKTMEVRLETSFELRPRVPSSCLAVSESGVKTADDLRRLAGAGFHAALIGEQLMSAEAPGSELARLLEGARLLPVR